MFTGVDPDLKMEQRPISPSTAKVSQNSDWQWAGVIGGPQKKAKIANLANLLLDNSNFDEAFSKTHNEDKAIHKRPAGTKDVDHFETLMQMSKRFVVKGIEHTYDEKDKIFFLREATTERH